MVTTVQTLALQLARDLGINSLANAADVANRNLKGCAAADRVALITAINGAYVELFDLAPSNISESEVGDVLRAATGVALTATQYSATISALATYASWMIGCTIRIAGDANDNELTSSTTLARPYVGSSASGIAATVYADAIPLSSTISHILPPVRILGQAPIRMADNREDFIKCGGFSGWQTDSGQPKASGDPTVAFVDTRLSITATQHLQKFIRFNTLPSGVKSVMFRAKLKPPAYVVADIGTDETTDPGTQMPLEGMSAILLAIARKRISGDPLFGALDALPEINRQYQHAIAQLGNSQPYIGPKNGHYH